MVKCWAYISNIGLNDNHDIQHVRFVHIMNRVFFLTFMFMLIYIPINIFVEDKFMVTIIGVFLILNLFSFFLNHKKHFRFSGYYTFLLIISLLTFAIVCHNDIGLEYLMIPSSLGAFVVFKNKYDSLIIVFVFILACAFSQFAKYFILPPIEFTETSRMWFYYANILISFFISCSIIINFKIVIDTYEDQVLLQKHAIESHNKEITDSINYAKRIQLAKLPEKELIHTSLTDCFILYTPKDIVSGDFYYFQKNKHSLLLAAADCTGHGVPGALMSMIASEKLHEASSQSEHVSEILRLTNKGIKRSLRQGDAGTSSRDGMDIALCSIDPVKRTLSYSGANRPLWIIRKDSKEVEEIKATKHAIGGLTEEDQTFTEHSLQLKKGDSFYLFSDGYSDQFSQHGKKLTTKKFKQILLELRALPMSEQELQLRHFINEWKSEEEQIDDILVIGVRME